MRCPHCSSVPSSVTKTTRPLDEGLEEGELKQRTRKCRNCSRSFTTFEIHEELFRSIRGVTEPVIAESKAPKLTRQPLLAEETGAKRRKRGQLTKIKGVK